MSKILTANRVAAITTWLTGLSALIAAVVGTFPQSWQNVALAVAGVALKGVTALHFMTGSQKYDALVTPIPPMVHPVPAAEAPPMVTSALEAAVAALPDPPVAPEVAPIPPAVA